jgi:hypothetical protein
MAYRASALPQLDFYDLGTNLALWVSAFEILVHPGTGIIGYKNVLNLLEKDVFFYNPKLNHRSYTIAEGKSKKKRNVTLVQKTYFEINSARNHFMHGNPVHDGILFPRGKLQNHLLTIGVVLVYKCALMSFLKMFDRNKDVDVNAPPTPENEKIAKEIFWQHDFESALKKLRQPIR